MDTCETGKSLVKTIFNGYSETGKSWVRTIITGYSETGKILVKTIFNGYSVIWQEFDQDYIYYIQ